MFLHSDAGERGRDRLAAVPPPCRPIADRGHGVSGEDWIFPQHDKDNLTIGNRGDIFLCDPTMYVIVDGPPMVIESSGETDFAGEKTQFRVKARTDGRPLLAKAVTPEVDVNPQSAYVVLEKRG